jgi:hypothetical protein
MTGKLLQILLRNSAAVNSVAIYLRSLFSIRGRSDKKITMLQEVKE